MKKILVYICVPMLLAFSLQGVSDAGPAQRAAKPRPVRIIRSPAGSPDAMGSLRQQYGNILDNALGRGAAQPSVSGGMRLGAKMNAANILSNPQVQSIVNSGLLKSANLQAPASSLNGGGLGNQAVMAALSKMRSQPLNGISGPVPGRYGPVLSGSESPVKGISPASSPVPSTYAALASQPASASITGSVAPGQYSTLAYSTSFTVAQYDLNTSSETSLSLLASLPQGSGGQAAPVHINGAGGGNVTSQLSELVSAIQNAPGAFLSGSNVPQGMDLNLVSMILSGAQPNTTGSLGLAGQGMLPGQSTASPMWNLRPEKKYSLYPRLYR